MIIKSLLDTDSYKLSMQQAVLSRYPNIIVKYKFHNRNPKQKFDSYFVLALRREIDSMKELKLEESEEIFLRLACPYLSEEYISFLKNFRYDPSEVKLNLKDQQLELEIEGLWANTILWEVPLLALISELYYKEMLYERKYGQYPSKMDQLDYEYLTGEYVDKKVEYLQHIKWADFGTRRRHNYVIHDILVKTFRNKLGFIGTSNLTLAHKHNVKPIGTMAHEWIMGISALEGLRHANRHALQIWSDIFRGDLGIALSDTFGTNAFLEDFDLPLSKLFDGVRQDSGDPIAFGEQIVKHYENLGIDPTTKTIVFSDSLTPERACIINEYFKEKIQTAFGIGTNLTNDFTNPALNIVIKMDRCNEIPVVKLSDSAGKAIGDSDALRVANRTFYNKPLDEDREKESTEWILSTVKKMSMLLSRGCRNFNP